jgi:hypothetical protein
MYSPYFSFLHSVFSFSLYISISLPDSILLSSVLRRLLLKLDGRTPWVTDRFISWPLQSVQSISSHTLLYCRGALNPHKDKWQHDSLDGGSHHHKASNSTRQHINLSTNTHVPWGIPNRVQCTRHKIVSFLDGSVTGIGQVRKKNYNTQSYPELERKDENRMKLLFYLQNSEYEHYIDKLLLKRICYLSVLY